MEKNEKKSLTRARDFIFKKTSIKPEIGVILGSGLGAFAEQLKDSTVIPYSKIPGFQRSEVKGHSNELYLGKLRNKKVAVMKGRYHYYEGYSIFDVTFPVRTLHVLGVKKLIITNAAGSLKKTLPPGSLMFIKDHINLSARNPLIGVSSEFGEKFIDLTDAYSKKLLKKAQAVAKKLMIKVKSGVYVFLTGPSYETPAEVKMLEKLGGTAVGMSTVPEVIVANQLGLDVLGISSITNFASGLSSGKIHHKEVIEVNKRTSKAFMKLLKNIILHI